jgi:hypothetical protein
MSNLNHSSACIVLALTAQDRAFGIAGAGVQWNGKTGKQVAMSKL